MFLDGTAQYHSIEAMPGMDRGAQVLIVHPDGGQIVEVPWNDPEKNGIRQSYEATVSPDGAAEVKVKMDFLGDVAVQIRSAFAVEGQRKLRLNMLLGQFFGKAELEDFQFSDLTDLSRIDATLDLDAKVPQFAEKTARGLELKLGYDRMRLSSLASAAERKWDILLGPPNSQTTTGVYHLPKGYKVVSRPDDVSIDHPWGKLELKITVGDDGSVRFTRTLVFKAHRIPKDDYEAFREFAAAADLAAREKVIIAAE
jgi:hypothetical protein